MQTARTSWLTARFTAALLFVVATNVVAANNYKENYKGEAMAPAPCLERVMLKDGFYAGAAAGYDAYRVVNDFSIVDPVFGAAEALDARVSAYGGAIGVFVGYGKYFTDYYNAYLVLKSLLMRAQHFQIMKLL